MRSSKLFVSALLLVLIGLCASNVLAIEKNASYATALESIATSELQQHVDYLAQDELEGREAGSRGSHTAGNYLGQLFKKHGLRTMGDDGRYFQHFAPNFRNVLGMIEGSDPKLKQQVIVVGAHYDHVGYGTHRNSRGPIGYVHNGADDNASGTSGLVELIEAFSILAQPPKRSILFAAWDAEEKGLLGSKHWTANPTVPLGRVVFLFNMDMIGRLRQNQLTILGSRTGFGIRRLTSRQNDHGLEIDFSWDFKPNADHAPFFDRRIPVLTFHTGKHAEYHCPSDDAHLINGSGMRQVVQLAFATVHELANRAEPIAFREAAGHETPTMRRQLAEQQMPQIDRFGATWQKWNSSDDGVRLTMVEFDSPADRATLKPGDHILRFAGRAIRSSDDLDTAIMVSKSPAKVVAKRRGWGEPVDLSVNLNGKPLRLGISWQVDSAEPGTIILTHVVPGSPADRAKLEVGDRIYRVAGRPFDNDAHFVKLTEKVGQSLELLVERDGRMRAVTVDLSLKPIRRAA